MLLFAILLILLSIAYSSKSPLQREEEVLCSIITQLGGPLCRRLSAPCSWKGMVTCDEEGIRGLDLNNLKMQGTLPIELFNFKLSQLSLSGNQLFGTIPSEIGRMSASLLGLDLSSNSLTGTIPSSLMMDKLVYLDLGSNSLRGRIPSSISRSSQLILLSLSSNLLTGSLPSSMSQSISLQQLWLQRNSLSGSLPLHLLCRFPLLHELVLHTNSFNGTLSSGIKCLSSMNILSLRSNSFTGTLPSSLATLTNLKHLSLSANRFHGSFPPPQIQKAVYLSHLSLHSNQLNGTLVPEIGSLTSLTHLSLHQNLFSGTVPTSIFKLTNLQNLSLHSNNFQSTHFSTIGNLSFYLHFHSETVEQTSCPNHMPPKENDRSVTADDVGKAVKHGLDVEREVESDVGEGLNESRMLGQFSWIEENLLIGLLVVIGLLAFIFFTLMRMFQRNLNHQKMRVHPSIGLRFLFSGMDWENSIIVEVLDAGFLVPALNALSTSQDERLLIASLCVIGSILSGNEEQIQTVLDHNVLSIFTTLLRNPAYSLELKRHVFLAISNISVESASQLQQVLDSKILTFVLDLGNQLQRESAYCLSYAIIIATPPQVETLLEMGVLRFLISLPSPAEYSLDVLKAMVKILEFNPAIGREFDQATIERVSISVKADEANDAAQLVDEFLTLLIPIPEEEEERQRIEGE
jgi:hypothetical protein